MLHLKPIFIIYQVIITLYHLNSLYDNIIYNIRKIIVNFYIQTILINIILC